MVFQWSLRDCKSPQFSRTRFRILVVLSNAVIWIVSTRPPTSKSSRPFNNPLVIVPKAPITIGTIVTFMFHSFLNSLARSGYLSFFSLSFRFILWSAGTAKSTILQILLFLWIIIRSSLLAGIRWSVCPIGVYACHFLGQVLIILFFWQFFTAELTDGFSQESAWHILSSSLHDSSSRSQQCSSLDGLHLSSYFQDFQSLYQSFGDSIIVTKLVRPFLFVSS